MDSVGHDHNRGERGKVTRMLCPLARSSVAANTVRHPAAAVRYPAHEPEVSSWRVVRKSCLLAANRRGCPGVRPPRVEHQAIETQVLPGGWSEIGGFVRWDKFYFHHQRENVGYAIVVPVSRLIDDTNVRTLFMKGIAVAPRHRRRGIGYLIMRTVWDYYRDQGVDWILLNTGDENVVAQRFYRSIGFEMTDVITSYVADRLTV